MNMTDIWLNPLEGGSQTASVLGYREDLEEFPHDLYSFFLSSLREEDIKDVRLWYRFIYGMRIEWESIYGKILNLPDLISPSRCPEDYLDYLKWNVGITDDLDYLWGELSVNEKRRLLEDFVFYLTVRSTNGGIVSLIEGMTGAKVQIRDYFDYRWIVSGDKTTEQEGAIGREDEGYDPWLLSEDSSPVGIEPDLVTGGYVSGVWGYSIQVDTLIAAIVDGPSPPNPPYVRVTYRPTGESAMAILKWTGSIWVCSPGRGVVFGQSVEPYSTTTADFRVGIENDAYVFDIRIIDDGNLNREMVKALAKFSRPRSERIYIRYYNLLEAFDEDNINNWTEIGSTVTHDQDNDVLELASSGSAVSVRTNATGDTDWTSYCVGAQALNETVSKYFEIRFFYQDSDNYMYARFTPNSPPTVPSGTWAVRKVVSGADSAVMNGNLDYFDLDVNYFWRIVAAIEGNSLTIRVYQDENLLGENNGADPWTGLGGAKGKVELLSEAAGSVTVSSVEIYPYPMESDYVGP